MLDRSLHVGVAQDRWAGYPAHAPFHPGERFPESQFDETDEGGNRVYALVREALHGLGLDDARYGSAAWNPLGEIIRPGMIVLLKPNMVLHRHPRGGDLNCLITHGSVVRAVLDFATLALQGRGRIVIGDSPLQGTDFEESARQSGIAAVVAWYRERNRVPIQLVDFRNVRAIMDARNHVLGWTDVQGDPSGSVSFDLGANSMLVPIEEDSSRFRVSNYQASDTGQYHRRQSHRYVMAGSVIDADVIVSLPKMKTHCKVGVTLSMKNMVGTVGRKQCLAHHRHGGAGAGGDEYPGRSRLKGFSVALEGAIDGNQHRVRREALKLVYRANERVIKTVGLDPLRDGGWYGNDTAWRMVIDLVRIALYGRRDGTLAQDRQRAIFTVIDGVVGGENEGPLEATSVTAGTIVAGLNPVVTDLVTTALMGLDHRVVAMLRESCGRASWPLAPRHTDAPTTRFRVNGASVTLDDVANGPMRMDFAAPMGWVGRLERRSRPAGDPAPSFR